MKTTVNVLARHRASFEAFRQQNPHLTLTQFYADSVDFRLQYSEDASLKPILKAQATLVQKVEAVSKLLANPLVDHVRLELHAKHIAENLAGQIGQVQREVGQ